MNPIVNQCGISNISTFFADDGKRALLKTLSLTKNVTERGSRYEVVRECGKGNASKAIYYIHGGAFVAPLNIFYRNLSSYFIKAANDAEVVLLDYSLAPEFCYPTQLDEAYDVWNEITDKLGYSPKDVLIGGDSAGGNIVLSLMLKLRDEGREMPLGAFCISPWADMTASGESYFKNYGRDVVFGQKGVKATDELRLRLIESTLFSPVGNIPLEKRSESYISPVFGEYHGFPPMMFTVGEYEMLFSDTYDIAKKLEKENIQVELEIGKRMFHVYALLRNILPESRRSFKRILAFIEKCYKNKDL